MIDRLRRSNVWAPWTSLRSAGAMVVLLTLAGPLPGRHPHAAAPSKVDQALATPDAERIPVPQLESAARQAVTNGVATVLARIMADGNDTGLAYPPTSAWKQEGFEEVPARRQQVEEAVYEDVWKDVEQLVPEKSGGVPTGRYVRGSVRTLVKRTKVGTKTVERLVRDPQGTERMTVPKYARSGPDLYEPNLLGLNGMALYVLARAGLQDHAATKRLAQALDERMNDFGVSDHTFEVAWLAAGFTALGPESPHRKRADQLIAKLIDGQIRQKGEPHGLWGPVCIHSSYLARLLEIEDQLRQELEVNLPKKLEAMPPQQQAAMTKQWQEMRKVSGDVTRACRSASSLGMRMKAVTEPYVVNDTARIPGLPYSIYDRVVADVDSTAVATFALAEAARVGMLPKETPRFAIRGKKVALPEKTSQTVTSAAEKLAQSIGESGGCSVLTLQAVNTGFDTCRIPIPGVPFKGRHPPLFNLETASSCVNALAALESLAVVDPKALDRRAAERDRARGRATEIAERWYRETSPAATHRKAWPSVYATFTVPQAALKESDTLPLPTPESPPVAELPWGGFAAQYSMLPAFATLFGAGDAKDVLQDGLYRRLAYRLVGLQDVNGQWQGVSHDSLSAGKDALALNACAKLLHAMLERTSTTNIKQDPIPFNVLLLQWRSVELHRGVVSPDSHRDRGAYATLASLVLLLRGMDGPVNVDDVVLRPTSSGPPETSDQAETKTASRVAETPMLRAVTAAERPNSASAALLDGILAASRVQPADAPSAEPDTNEASTASPASRPADDDGLGSVDDLLQPEAP